MICALLNFYHTAVSKTAFRCSCVVNFIIIRIPYSQIFIVLDIIPGPNLLYSYAGLQVQYKLHVRVWYIYDASAVELNLTYCTPRSSPPVLVLG